MKTGLGISGLVAMLLTTTGPAMAIEPDGPQLKHAERNAEAWAAEDAAPPAAPAP